MVVPARPGRLSELDAGRADVVLDRSRAVLLDLREPDEGGTGAAPRARQLPLGALPSHAVIADDRQPGESA
jgi:rhodanese-related sulfurtransferase